MSINRKSKQNGVATQLHNKKPSDCRYGSKKITIPFDQRLEEEMNRRKWNEEITEVLGEIPNSPRYLFLKKVFIECGLRKES